VNTKEEIESIYEKRGVLNESSPLYIVKGEHKYELKEGRIKELTAKFLESCHNMADDYPDFNKNVKMVNLLVDVKKAWFPAVQKSLTGNMEDFDKSLEKWYVLQKEIMEVEKEKIEVAKNSDK